MINGCVFRVILMAFTNFCSHILSLSLLQGVEKLIEFLSAQTGGEAWRAHRAWPAPLSWNQATGPVSRIPFLRLFIPRSRSDMFLYWKLLFLPLDQQPENVFSKGPDSKYFRFCGPLALCKYSTLPVGGESSRRQHTNKPDCCGANKISFTKNGLWTGFGLQAVLCWPLLWTPRKFAIN